MDEITDGVILKQIDIQWANGRQHLGERVEGHRVDGQPDQAAYQNWFGRGMPTHSVKKNHVVEGSGWVAVGSSLAGCKLHELGCLPHRLQLGKDQIKRHP